MLPRERTVRHNFLMGVLNGAIFQFGVAFVDPTTVMPVFIKNFTDSDSVVGLASSVRRAGWLLPQLPMAGYLESRPYKMGVYVWGNAVRLGLIWLFIPFMAIYSGSHPGPVLWGFLAMFTFSSLAGGFAGSPFTDIVGKTIPSQYRGLFYAIRMFFGAGLLSILAGVVIQYILASGERFPFPDNYTIIFILFAGFMTLGVSCFGFVKEPPGKVGEKRRSVGQVFRGIPELLRRDVNFRRVLTTQVLAAGLGFSLPFYVVFARERFGVTEGATGIFLAVQTVGATLANVVWARVSARRGSLAVIRLNLLAQAVIPVYALVLGFGFAEVLRGGPMVTVAFVPIFLLIGATISGNQVGFNSFLLDISPEDRRPTYVGMTNTTMGCASFFPAVGGILADLAHLDAVFMMSAVTGVLALVVCAKVKEPAGER